ncbi:metallophosphoesterase [Myxosarcina sp. GI1]|uniref:metallophosphoesterase family protein n=1 Tax=Myxosarcina sp. GI1 TaxID=1541065 RepID=UPI0009E091F0|nr:metallophosphoesterase [Myxosarcina sp. GI1]
MKLNNFTWWFLIIILLIIAWSTITSIRDDRQSLAIKSLLSDPFLQLPTPTSVNVVWFTEFSGDRHWVTYGQKLENKAVATTTKLSRVREDKDSEFDNNSTKPKLRNIWRHEAVVKGLSSGQVIPYQVSSELGGAIINSSTFTLSSLPAPGTPLRILLTSDHQLMPMTTANLQKVTETIDNIDAVFMAGDLVNVPDRASEWFDDNRGGAFFPGLQGRASYELETNGVKTTYQGGEIIQHAPLFTAIGNHEVMGRFSTEKLLKEQFNDGVPRSVAADYYRQTNPNGDRPIPHSWLVDNSFNTNTYEEIFSLPQSDRYYAVTFGDIRLVVLYVTNTWRSPDLEPDVKGRYQERQADLDNPWEWGYGQHIFEPIAKGSSQYQWLETELNSEAFRQAKYKMVMFHHPPHTLGGNIVPAYTDPQPQVEYEDNKITSVRYQYPIAKDYIIQDLIPLLESAGVQLVYYGHSHLWNRFIRPSGMHFLESSNVGNTYGAHLGDNKRSVPEDDPEINYATVGDPNGLEAIVPSIAPLIDESGVPLPYIASNEITVFSIFDTATGTISSYRYNTSQPESPVVKFDEFSLD